MTPTDDLGTVTYRDPVPFGEQPAPIDVEPEHPDILAAAYAAVGVTGTGSVDPGDGGEA